jgi:two-component system OmpR family sensor kinase
VTLRLRLLVVLVGMAAVGLLAADIATYASLRSYLFSQVDAQLQNDAVPIGQRVANAAVLGRPGVANVIPPPGLWVELRDQSGNTAGPFEAYPLPTPVLPLQLPGSGSSSTLPVLFDASSGGASPVAYRVLAEPIAVEGAQLTVIVALPLNDLHHTLGRLLRIEVLVTLAVLAGLGALAWWMVRRGLRPLDEMTATAGAIAGGDLSKRVGATDERTEVGQLGQALNTMLTGIEQAFAARAASEERLRRFLADASHELRTPLTSIRGYAEIFDRGARDRPEDLATSMRHIKEEASRMSALVDDLLLLARLDHQRPLARDPVDLTAVAVSAVDAARVAAPDRHITPEVSGEVRVTGDADRLRQVFDNLLANTVRHTPEGSPVEVRVRSDGAWAWIEVIDHGPGIPVEEQTRVFEPFHRSDPSRARATGGVGLGLAIVSAIAHAHGGGVGVLSDGSRGHASGENPGATFWVRLPLAVEATATVGESGGRNRSPSN